MNVDRQTNAYRIFHNDNLDYYPEHFNGFTANDGSDCQVHFGTHVSSFEAVEMLKMVISEIESTNKAMPKKAASWKMFKYLFVALLITSMFSFCGKAKASINDIISQKSSQYGVDARLVHAVIKQESGYNPKAVSSAGASGIMQLMPDTAKRFSVKDLFNPEQNITGGVKYLKFLLDLFDGDIVKSVAGYNAGEGAVLKYNGVPPYAETKDYVKKVVANYKSKKLIHKAESPKGIDKPKADSALLFSRNETDTTLLFNKKERDTALLFKN